jgi:methionyl-tRNA formyltransferase
MISLRIIFMGTPEFAVPSLEILIANAFNVVAVVTAPDKPRGRGQKIVFSPVKACALKHKIPVLQPTNLKSPEFQEELKSYNANLQIVVAFRMLPDAVWSMPALGTLNLHASLLPQYRGAAPINWAIINGEKETGVTTFFLKHEIDTGSIIFQDKVKIADTDTAETLHDRLMEKGARLVLKTTQAIAAGSYPSVPQPSGTGLKAAPKIFRQDCAIDWSRNVQEVANFVRGLCPHPTAWTIFNGKTYKIYRVSPVEGRDDERRSGEFITDNKTFLHVRVGGGWIAVLELQPEGKKRMKTEDYFRGNTV